MGTKGGRKINKDERRQIYEKFDGHCAYCGREITYGEMRVDHVIPLREGGIDEVENMFPVCSVCNRYKKGNEIEAFRRGISTIPKKLERDVFTYRVGIIYGFLPIKRQNVVFYFEKVEEENLKVKEK